MSSPRRKPETGFNLGAPINLAAIPVLSAGVYFLMQWALTGDTLKRHDEAINKIQIESKAATEEERKSRDDARKVFLDNQIKTTEVLGKLDTRLAVSETKQEVTNQTLSKIADELARISSTAPRR